MNITEVTDLEKARCIVMAAMKKHPERHIDEFFMGGIFVDIADDENLKGYYIPSSILGQLRDALLSGNPPESRRE